MLLSMGTFLVVVVRVCACFVAIRGVFFLFMFVDCKQQNIRNASSLLLSSSFIHFVCFVRPFRVVNTKNEILNAVSANLLFFYCCCVLAHSIRSNKKKVVHRFCVFFLLLALLFVFFFHFLYCGFSAFFFL